MESFQPDGSLSELIDELKNRQHGVAGSLGESTASMLAYVEALETRNARLEEPASET